MTRRHPHYWLLQSCIQPSGASTWVPVWLAEKAQTLLLARNSSSYGHCE